MADTPDLDHATRDLCERLYSAYAQQAAGPMHPQQEQVLLSRLAEAIRSAVGQGSPEAIVAAANAVLDAWEIAEPAIRGPRVRSVDLSAPSVTLVAGR